MLRRAGLNRTVNDDDFTSNPFSIFPGDPHRFWSITVPMTIETISLFMSGFEDPDYRLELAAFFVFSWGVHLQV